MDRQRHEQRYRTEVDDTGVIFRFPDDNNAIPMRELDYNENSDRDRRPDRNGEHPRRRHSDSKNRSDKTAVDTRARSKSLNRRGQDALHQKAELLETLPSHQQGAVEAMVRDKTFKSVHGTLRMPHGKDGIEMMSRTLLADETLDAEDIDDMIRGMSTTLHKKRAIKHRVSLKQRKRPGYFKQVKYSISMGWQQFRYQLEGLMYVFELWASHLKKVEGHFGTGVKTYFLFLKWLFLINISTFVLTMGFVVIPQMWHHWSSHGLDDKFHTNVQQENFTAEGFFTGTGWFESSELFYGFYTNESIPLVNGLRYEMIYAYLFTCGAYYLLCLIIIGQSILQSYRKFYLQGMSEVNFCLNKVFCGWDYGISQKEAAILKQNSIYNELLEYLSTKKKKEEKTIEEKCAFFWIRVLVNIFFLSLLVASGFFVYYMARLEPIQTSVLVLPVLITLMNRILPIIFSYVQRFEKYEKPENELLVDMLRTMALRILNLAVLCHYWFITAPTTKKCWETYMGQEIYRLVLIDFFFTLIFTFYFEFIRRLIAQYFCARLGRAEFGIGRMTLDLIYAQALCWLGTFYSPLLSCVVIIKLWIIFYVKRFSVVQNCQPSVRPWRASRTHTIFLGFLMVFFLLTTVAVSCSIVFLKPSRDCGPYQGKNTTYQIVGELIDSMKDEHRWINRTITIISSPGVIAGIIILLSMGSFYMRIAMLGHKEMVELLQQQMALDGKDKNFLLQLLQQVNSHRRGPRGSIISSTSSGGGQTHPTQKSITSLASQSGNSKAATPTHKSTTSITSSPAHRKATSSMQQSATPTASNSPAAQSRQSSKHSIQDPGISKISSPGGRYFARQKLEASQYM